LRIERDAVLIDGDLDLVEVSLDGLSREALRSDVDEQEVRIGAAGDQVDAVVAGVDALVARYPDAAKYTPGAIL